MRTNYCAIVADNLIEGWDNQDPKRLASLALGLITSCERSCKKGCSYEQRMATRDSGVLWKINVKVIASANCLGSKFMRLILSTNDLVKACNRSKIQKDIGKILFPDPKDTSVKIHKDTSRKILLQENHPHRFRHEVPKIYPSPFTTQPCKCLRHVC